MTYYKTKDGSFVSKDDFTDSLTGIVQKFEDYEGKTKDGKKFRVYKIHFPEFEISFNQSGYAFAWLIDAFLEADIKRPVTIKAVKKDKWVNYYLNQSEPLRGQSTDIPKAEKIELNGTNTTNWTPVLKWINGQIKLLNLRIDNSQPFTNEEAEDIPF